MTQEEAQETEIKYKITPTSHFNVESTKKEWNLEIHLPGVDKSKIKFRVLPKYFDLSATRDNAHYSLSGHFPWEVDIDTVKGDYEEGLLYITGKIKNPMDDAYRIKLE
ncbi:hypothetical protein NEF87_000262 [Candidatus Lokiarchaeum ossiferum]|uniref:CS domain-containing protein n=1 Tax=Candidatus Lokiarchaeum ossiferum TaxID=2951803 RepID=A0ABY6HM64_9ARCH|nr:hypothetical protein NEF87_000262 [Candidatus Lokiarchaeum sp. B-35]